MKDEIQHRSNRQDESSHPGGQDYITPHHTEIISMAGASKAIRLPKPVAYKKLLAAHANACHLVPKVGEVKLRINSFSVDMLCITEMWLNSDVAVDKAYLENYNIFRGERQSGRRRGGVAFYVKSEL